MRIIRLRLSVRDPFPPERIKAALYSSSVPGDMLEHLYIEMAADQAELVFFLHEDVGGHATVTVLRLWARVVGDNPPLEAWTVLEADPARVIDPGRP